LIIDVVPVNLGLLASRIGEGIDRISKEGSGGRVGECALGVLRFEGVMGTKGICSVLSGLDYEGGGVCAEFVVVEEMIVLCGCWDDWPLGRLRIVACDDGWVRGEGVLCG